MICLDFVWIYRVRSWAVNVWAVVIGQWSRPNTFFGGFGPPRPNIRNSCPELKKADVSDILGFVSCQACPECRVVVMSNRESFFWKFLNMRRQLDLMADVNHWRTWRERVCGLLVFVL
ncbi:hypothetical protein PIB30_055406 [Stylosanthes scabra]|uniref:Uncharacterized protein n=1 Tax=Stylosanthes scabra TaxID=79078 RepID=A0ABU6WHL0_9FABA|nr:hypothetical protein [Stylosanthes scabra]